MNEQNPLVDQVLGRVADDYEAPHTIAGDISRDLGRLVSEREVLDVLLLLAKQGQVQAYLYEKSLNQFVPVVSVAGMPADLLWFMVPRN